MATQLLDRYDTSQLETIADFLTSVVAMAKDASKEWSA